MKRYAVERCAAVSLVMLLTAACAGGTPAPVSQTPAAGSPNGPSTATVVRPVGRTPTPSPVASILPATATIAHGRTRIEVGDYFFDPRVVTVTVGTTVTWLPVGDLAHTIESAASPPVFFGGTGGLGTRAFAFTFQRPGTYAYYCRNHPAEMDAWVVVIADD